LCPALRPPIWDFTTSAVTEIMISVSQGFSLLIATSLFRSSLSVDTTIQADLVFPKNNSVYQLVFPFPIVFALHNFSTAWHYNPLLWWRLLYLQPPRMEQSLMERTAIGWEDDWATTPDKFLAINFTKRYLMRTNQILLSSTFLE
jgi:hypothetical protein